MYIVLYSCCLLAYFIAIPTYVKLPVGVDSTDWVIINVHYGQFFITKNILVNKNPRKSATIC